MFSYICINQHSFVNRATYSTMFVASSVIGKFKKSEIRQQRSRVFVRALIQLSSMQLPAQNEKLF